MKIKLWGTRGSIPTPSTSSFVTSKYGGDTTCLSIEFGGEMVVIDGGSGLRRLGLEMMLHPQLKTTFFFTHVHWDHIQGFPFFVPAYNGNNRFLLYGPRLVDIPSFIGTILEKALRGQQEDLNFPIQLKDFPAKMEFFDLPSETSINLFAKDGAMTVTTGVLNHPGGCFGYRFDEICQDGTKKCFVVATDTEHYHDGPNPRLQKLAAGADILLYDGQYTPDEYEGRAGIPKKGWGHSTWEAGLKECLAAGIKHLVITHHDPMHDDTAVEAIEKAAREEGEKHGVLIEAAHESMEICL